MRSFILWFSAFIALAAAPALGAEGAPARSDNVEVRLVSDRVSIAPGETFYVGLHKTIAPSWHTYWRNAGDAGEATEITWSLPQGLSAGEILWPTPKVYTIGGVVTNYIFEEELLLNTPFTASDDLEPGQTLRIDAELYWQECAEICIPVDDIQVSLELPVVAPGAAVRDATWGPQVAETVANVAVPLGFEAGLTREGDVVRLSVADDALSAALAEGALRNPYFFPFSSRAIKHTAPQPATFGERGFSLALSPGRGLREELPDTSGVLAFEERRNGAWAQRSVEITAQQGAVDIGPILAAAGGAGFAAGSDGGAGFGGLSLLTALGFAFVGGLILNLMPCVFPVLSIKAMGFVSKAHDNPGEIRRHGLVFLAGVLVSFAVVAGALIVVSSAGAAVGWGFQLQSPIFVTALALLMFIIGLNLLGFFEIGTSLQGVGGGLADKGGDLGAFFTGVLAVVVATPCTAPFMASALGFALAQPPAAAMGVFLMLGLGLAAPFVALSFAPGLLRFLPKPGAWMDTFKQALSFPMFLTAIWLVWTVIQQAGADAAGWALIAMTSVAFAIWALKQAGGAAKIVARSAAVLGFVIAAGALALVSPMGGATAATATQAAQASEEAWSPERVAQLRAEGRGVFVDFTAAWCITCQVNKRTTLTTAAVQAAFAEHDVVFLTADWTNRDPVIAETLEKHGRAGVPLYLLYTGEGEPQILPPLLTPQIVIDAVKAAAAS